MGLDTGAQELALRPVAGQRSSRTSNHTGGADHLTALELLAGQIDMHDLDVLPEMLTVWRPAPAGPHSTPWTPDPRPASYLQEAHIREARITGPGPRPPPGWRPSSNCPGN
ncbi:hypothetical protein GCM10017771_46340 [Streptomyces capitiformicae]|uniref:Uncharacterized protein n=1 Tax=Streptomyces capitiformicae TaxID=2014920 RepID=A0A919DAX3_9ACTN|nr:hypothetical protein GCM10017771_46340 [Streptomyces capitiformicae]